MQDKEEIGFCEGVEIVMGIGIFIILGVFGVMTIRFIVKLILDCIR